MRDAEFSAFVERRNEESVAYGPSQRNAIAEYCRENAIAIASHDDTTPAHVDEAISQGRQPTARDSAAWRADGGANRNRTDDLLNAIQTLSQLSYGPNPSHGLRRLGHRSAEFI